MDRRSLLFMLGGAAFAVAMPVVAAPGVTKPITSTVRVEVPLPPMLALLLVLHLAARDVFHFPATDGPLNELEQYGLLERKYEDAAGVYWKLTPGGERLGAKMAKKFKDGVIYTSVRMTERV